MYYLNYKSQEMILRDHLAYDRTVLALERTALSYLRTVISLLAAGFTLLFIYPENIVANIGGWVLIGFSICAGIYGIRRSIKMHKDLSKIYDDYESVHDTEPKE